MHPKETNSPQTQPPVKHFATQDEYYAGVHCQKGCCVIGGVAETTKSREETFACVRVVADAEDANRMRSERKRDKARRFTANKGPRLVGAAAAIGMFIFNVISSCT